MKRSSIGAAALVAAAALALPAVAQTSPDAGKQPAQSYSHEAPTKQPAQSLSHEAPMKQQAQSLSHSDGGLPDGATKQR